MQSMFCVFARNMLTPRLVDMLSADVPILLPVPRLKTLIDMPFVCACCFSRCYDVADSCISGVMMV